MTSKNRSGDNGATDKNERKRFIYQQWVRDPNGPILIRDQAPKGRRTPNGQVWGHSLSDLFYIERVPGLACLTGWSMSMLQEWNESPSPSYKQALAAAKDRSPRVLQPWPLLCIPNDKGELETLCLGGDEGCERGHNPISMLHRIREIGDYLELGTLKIPVSNFTPEQKQLLFSTARTNLKQTITKGIKPEILKDDPRFHIPDQSPPWTGPLPPKLEESISKDYLPDVLLVYDPCDVTDGSMASYGYHDTQFDECVPIRYTRAHPEPMTDGHSSNSAQLYLSPRNLCGTGNHSFVYHAPMVLPAPLTARTPTRQVTVLAKISFPESEHRDLLNQEGIIYGTFAQWMMEDYCGYNVVPKILVGVLTCGCSHLWVFSLDPVPACAIVPKFYGFYVPEDKTRRYLSPILLLEDCGLPVNTATLCVDDRTQLFAMFVNLHHAGFLQGSIYPRNMLIQPGPLTLPPSERSLASPSFRIIDFGRAEYKPDFLGNAIGVAAWERHQKWLTEYNDFITTVGAAEAEKEYTITVYDNEDGEGKAKSREVTMVMGLEKRKWAKLQKARLSWLNMVMEADGKVRATLGLAHH